MFHSFKDLNRFSVWYSKKNKSLWTSDDIADQITRRNDDTLGIPRANLELKYCHMFIIYFNSVQWQIVEWNRPCNFYYDTNISLFVFFRTLLLLSLPCWQILKVKSRNTTFICWLWSKLTIKTPEWCLVVLIFNLKHIQQMNLIFYC